MRPAGGEAWRAVPAVLDGEAVVVLRGSRGLGARRTGLWPGLLGEDLIAGGPAGAAVPADCLAAGCGLGEGRGPPRGGDDGVAIPDRPAGRAALAAAPLPRADPDPEGAAGLEAGLAVVGLERCTVAGRSANLGRGLPPEFLVGTGRGLADARCLAAGVTF